MRIRNQAGRLAVSLGLALVAVGPAFAKHAREVQLDQAVTINGQQLKPGKYQVNWETQGKQATVTFKHRKSVVTTTGTLVSRPNTTEHDTVVYTVDDNGASTVLELRFAGSNEVLSFDNTSPSGSLLTPEKTALAAARF